MFKDFDANAMMYPPGAPLPRLDQLAQAHPGPPTPSRPGDEPDSDFMRSVAAFTATINQRLLAAHAAEKVRVACVSYIGAPK